LLRRVYLALAVALAKASVFYAFGIQMAASLWVVAGAALVWLGLRQRERFFLLFGMALQLAAAAYFVYGYGGYNLTRPLWNDFVVGCALIAAAGFVTARLLHLHARLEPLSAPVAGCFVGWGGFWLLVGGLHAIADLYSATVAVAIAVGWFTAVFLAAEAIGRQLRWPALRLLSLAHLPALVVAAFTVRAVANGFTHPLGDGGLYAWPSSFAVYFWTLHRQQRDGLVTLHGERYSFGILLLTVLATWEMLWLLLHAFHGSVLGLAATGFAVAFIRWSLREAHEALDQKTGTALSRAVLAWSVTFWIAGGAGVIDRDLGWLGDQAAWLLFAAASVLAAEAIGARLGWPDLRRLAVLLPLAALAALAVGILSGSAPFDGYGALAWPLLFTVGLSALARQRAAGIALAPRWQGAAWLWLAAIVLLRELVLQFSDRQYGSGWLYASWGAVPLLLL